MDLNQTTDLIHLAKAASLSAAGCAVVLGLFRLIRDLHQPRALAKAVKSLDTQQERETMVELFRIARPWKTVRRTQRGRR